ncbi:MAG: 3-hydroxyacyl-ACP dehydratase FabZ [Candidatus Marinimicrobia bacterium]|jgi:beta-hydroxyacyl-ACP dehydratase FabZ|nr:3-hydroxyacyl-ACP dehydratase FabZ [Candidatus Neomarinimicrobiota bacterium]|tara:strand:+ start:587 stop:1033 length:447 start_codon:yes stop_codon:yes gene_type:complete
MPKPSFLIEDILKIVPHRYPFILIDRILSFDSGNSLTAIKNVTINEHYFQGHFPNQPLMPGVLILEAMAQAGAFLVLNTVDDPLKKNMFFTGVSDSKFRAPVTPGDQLRLEMELVKMKLSAVQLKGEGYVEDKLVAQARIMANIVDRV